MKRPAYLRALKQARAVQQNIHDDRALVFNPFERRYEPAEDYQRRICGPMMTWFDQLSLVARRQIANSVDGE